MSFEAKILLDSVSPSGVRLTTVSLTYPRFIHAELMTYRMLSRNSASSRAIPIQKMIRRILDDPAHPVQWGRNQKGMQARSNLEGMRLWFVRQLWFKSRYLACAIAYLMYWAGLHKQVTNRILEPWMFITVLVTANEPAFRHMFAQRCHVDAQPEFQYIATLLQTIYDTHKPTTRVYHWPLVLRDDYVPHGSTMNSIQIKEYMTKISVARCARVSYLTHDGRRDHKQDLRLYNDLYVAQPPHTSPFEHAATATLAHERHGNFVGWRQHRQDVESELGRTNSTTSSDVVSSEPIGFNNSIAIPSNSN